MIAHIPSGTSVSALAEWLAKSPNLSEGVALRRGREAFIDTVACCLAGAHDLVSERVFEAVRSSNIGACSVVGRNETLSAEAAALVNGTAAHALDFDDNFNPAVTHASAVLVPALLALGEVIGVSGGELLDAYIAGLEVQAWLGRQMIPAHYAAGWHATSTIGTVGVAGACARLLRVDAERACWALSIATSMAGGSKVQFGTMAKPLHAGLAARAGITAARLASAGVAGNDEPFAGEWGFVALHHGESLTTADRDEAASPGLAIVSAGLAQKRFPCCASAHRTMDAIITLMSEHLLQAAEIERIETVVPDYDYKNMPFDRPKDELQARFSMTYCAAVAALYGRVTLVDFTKKAVERHNVRDWLDRVSMYSMGTNGDGETGIWELPAVTTLLLKDGKRLKKEVFQPVGTIHAPISEREMAEKFRDCARRCLCESETEELYQRLTNLEQEKICDIVALIRTKDGARATAASAPR